MPTAFPRNESCGSGLASVLTLLRLDAETAQQPALKRGTSLGALLASAGSASASPGFRAGDEQSPVVCSDAIPESGPCSTSALDPLGDLDDARFSFDGTVDDPETFGF